VNVPAPETNIRVLEALAARIRGHVIEMSHRAGTPHLGSALSCIDLLVAAYWTTLQIDPARPTAPHRDRFILSKGHAVSALYATLAERGYSPVSDLAGFGQIGSALAEQPTPNCAPGI